MGQFECLENYVFCVKNTHLLVEMLEDFQTWHHHSDFKINGTYLGFFSTQHHPRNDKCLTSKKAKLHATYNIFKDFKSMEKSSVLCSKA